MKFLFFFLMCLVSFKSFAFEDFPEDEDKILILQHCVLCHSESLVSSQGMSKKAWDKTLLWMEEEHNLVFYGENAREKILAYLSQHFGVEEEGDQTSEMGVRVANPLP